MAKIPDAESAFMTKLQALYDIENAILKALPKMEKSAFDPELKKGFKQHLKETEGQVKRLEEAFSALDAKPKKLKCEGIRGIIEDGEWVMKEADAPEDIADGMLAGAARYVEHYEMAGYMSAIAQAEFLGFDDIADLLKENLAEEEMTDKKLEMAMKESMERAEALEEEEDEE